MRKIYSLFIVTLVMASCVPQQDGSLEAVLQSEDIKVIEQKKKELDEKQKNLSKDIERLSNRIAELDPNKNVPLITTQTVKRDRFTHYIELQGNVKTKQNVLIYPEMGGLLEEVFVREGQNVVEGQLLATIDDGGMQQQLAQVRATADLAKTTYERQKRLWDQKIGSEIQFLESKTTYIAAKNSVEQLEKQLDKYKITAPFTGVIDDIIQDEGTIVGPGQGSEVFRIVNLQNMYVEVEVPETYIPSVTVGKEVKVDFPVLGRTLDSKIRQAGNFINPANRTFVAEIPVPNKSKDVKPNLTARVQINDYTSPDAILIPQNIISENSTGEQYVYVVTDKKEKLGTAKRVIVITGKTQGDMIEILEGLQNNDEIVVEGARSVKSGQAVQIIK